ncbi:STY1053 family phage-associated protein [Pseudomonas citronellolis]|uniref:STY1053 family phage-associated protein n=1 Tax=Pseudomonas citronellolis TaxID=53408 RepID=UPI0023E376A7|nr:hypothetical protein [Pseudomonas citronellolis]MDF3936667.1 hypothetical protein [Pseudomonas citronellolis]
MAWLNVLKGFKLNLADGVKEFEAGLQEIEDELAKHWFVQAHSETLTAKQAKALQAASTAEQHAPETEPAAEPETPAAPATEAPAES